MKTNVLSLIALICVCTAYLLEKLKDHNPKAAEPWSSWSQPETIHPAPPFPQWVVHQYRTNLVTGEIKAKIISKGTAGSLINPESAIANP